MEIHAGEYVRTTTGTIYKLSYYNITERRWISVTDTDWFPVYVSQIVKHSYDIIDLIEAGDYVNGLLVNCVLEKEEKILRCVFPYRENSTNYKDLEEKGSDYCQLLHLRETDIKSIVTKEQFESIKYNLI